VTGARVRNRHSERSILQDARDHQAEENPAAETMSPERAVD